MTAQMLSDHVMPTNPNAERILPKHMPPSFEVPSLVIYAEPNLVMLDILVHRWMREDLARVHQPVWVQGVLDALHYTNRLESQLFYQ